MQTIELNRTIIRKIKSDEIKIDSSLIIFGSVFLLSLFLGTYRYFTDEIYKGLVLSIGMLALIPLIVFIATKVRFNDQIKEENKVIGSINFDDNYLSINDKEISLQSIEKIAIHINNHGSFGFSWEKLPLSENHFFNPDNISIGGKHGFHPSKTYSNITFYLKEGLPINKAFYIDSQLKNNTINNFISIVYDWNIEVREYNDGLKAYKTRTNLTYDEIQEVKLKHNLKSWV